MQVPLYRLQGHGDHFYTISAEERDKAVSEYGYTYEGIAGYISDSAEPEGPPAPMVTVLVPSPLELRDRFAMTAMRSLIAGRHYAGHYVGDPEKQVPEDARLAYAMADALIATRVT